MQSHTMDDHVAQLPAAVRPVVDKLQEVVRAVAPDAEEVVYQSRQPRSPSSMWKLARYRAGGQYVLGIGAFRAHASLFFYRGRELAGGSGLLQGGGKETRFVSLRSPAGAADPAIERLVRDAFELARSGPSAL